VQEVYARHEAHHLRFSKDGDYQQVSADTAITIELHDFSMLDAAGQKEKMAAAVKNDATTPFDLMRGPLLWVKILKLSDEHHVFLSTAHHIIFDGWSAGVFLDEISIVYNALCRGTPYRLPEAPRFSDYAAEEARQQSTAEGIDALQYWKSMFSDPPPFLDLPTDRPRPPVKSYRGASTHYEFDPAVYAAIKNVAAQQRTTLYALLLAAYNALLFRLSGQDDIVAGIPTAGQSTTDKHSLIGHCVNILPLRSRMKADMPFKEFLAATKTLLLDAQDHQQCTFGSILRTISLERNPARSPLVEVIFNLNRKLPGEGFHNLASSIHEVPKRAINWDMFLNMSETDTGLITDCDYNTDLFDEATIRRWLGHFETLLAAVAANPEQPLATIPVLSAADRTRLLTEWNATAADYPAAACIHTLIEAQARTTPDRVAVSCQGTTVTYRELDRRANQLARSLQQLGVGAQVPVGIFLERSCDMLIGLYAILKAGGAYVPLDPEYPQERLAYMISDAAIPVLVSQRSLEREIPPCAARVIYLDADPDIARQQATDLPAGAHNPEQAAYIIYTSGSTGKPKGVQVPHRAVVNFLTSMRREPGFSDNDVLLAVTTLSFDIAVLELFLPLIAGGTTVILPRDAAADGTRLQAALAESKATVMQATPGTWRLLLETGWQGSDRLKVLCGGEAFPRDLAAALHACCPNVWNMYGPTETTVWSTCYYLKHADGPVPIGRPINNTQVYILDDSRQPVPIGVPGELYIGGAGVALGYFKRPDLTAEKFVPSPFSTDPDDLLYRTGDLVKYHPDGAMEYLGRRDTQVKVRGFRIELGEIETVLCAHDAVAQAAVIVRQEGPGDTRLAAYVVASPGRTIDVSGLRAFLRSRLPEYMLPQHIVMLDALPLTPNNKIDRQALAQQQHDTAAAAQSFVAPATATEQALAALWQHVLNADRVGLHDNFFDLGGHSLLATRVVSRVRDIFNIELPLRTLFETPTVHLVAQHIDALRESSQQAQPARQGAADREVVEF
jgi:amino acid adenylation domain-containing protein